MGGRKIFGFDSVRVGSRDSSRGRSRTGAGGGMLLAGSGFRSGSDPPSGSRFGSNEPGRKFPSRAAILASSEACFRLRSAMIGFNSSGTSGIGENLPFGLSFR